MNQGLQGILGEVSQSAFLSNILEKLPLHGRVSTGLFEEIEKVLGDFSTETLSRKGRNVASVRHEGSVSGFVAYDVPASDAPRQLSLGNTILLPEIDAPELARWHEGLADQFGYPQSKKLLALFLAPADTRTRWHFDQIENFTIQLSGRRTWRWAANEEARYPLHNYSTALKSPLQSELPLYANSRLLGPKHADGSVTLEPGEFLYVPRGHWHEVGGEAGDTDSAALIVSFAVLTWLDVFVPAVRTLLIKQENWRKSVSSRAPRPQLEASFRKMKAELASMLDGIELRDLLTKDVAEFAPGCTYRLHPLVGIQFIDDSEGNEVQVFTRHQGPLSAAHQLSVSRELSHVVKELAEGGAVSSGLDDPIEQQRLVRALVERGLVVDCDAR